MSSIYTYSQFGFLLNWGQEFFELAVLAFGKLSCLDGRCYSKAVSIVEVLAKYRTCVLMWDLELDALVVQMFQHFLNNIRYMSNYVIIFLKERGIELGVTLLVFYLLLFICFSGNIMYAPVLATS